MAGSDKSFGPRGHGKALPGAPAAGGYRKNQFLLVHLWWIVALSRAMPPGGRLNREAGVNPELCPQLCNP